MENAQPIDTDAFLAEGSAAERCVLMLVDRVQALEQQVAALELAGSCTDLATDVVLQSGTVITQGELVGVMGAAIHREVPIAKLWLRKKEIIPPSIEAMIASFGGVPAGMVSLLPQIVCLHVRLSDRGAFAPTVERLNAALRGVGSVDQREGWGWHRAVAEPDASAVTWDSASSKESVAHVNRGHNPSLMVDGVVQETPQAAGDHPAVGAGRCIQRGPK